MPVLPNFTLNSTTEQSGRFPPRIVFRFQQMKAIDFNNGRPFHKPYAMQL